MTAQDQYAAKRREAGGAVGLIEDGSHVVVPTGVGEPPTILDRLVTVSGTRITAAGTDQLLYKAARQRNTTSSDKAYNMGA